MAAISPRWKLYMNNPGSRDTEQGNSLLVQPIQDKRAPGNGKLNQDEDFAASVFEGSYQPVKMAASVTADRSMSEVPVCRRPVRSLSVQDRSPVTFSADGTRAAFVSGSHHIAVLELADGAFQVKHLLTGHTGALRVLLFHPNDADTLLSGGSDGIVCWNVTSAKPVYTIPGSRGAFGAATLVEGGHDGDVESMCWCFGGATLLSGGKDALLKAWDWSVSPPVLLESVTGHKAAILCLAVHTGQQKLATAGRDSTIKVWDISTLSLEWRARRTDDSGITVGLLGNLDGHRGDVTSLTWTPPGLLLSGARDNRVMAWSTSTWTELREVVDTGVAARGMKHHSDVRRIGLLPDGQHVLSASTDGTVKVWRLGGQQGAAGGAGGKAGKAGKAGADSAPMADILGLGESYGASGPAGVALPSTGAGAAAGIGDGVEGEDDTTATLLDEILNTSNAHAGAKGGAVAAQSSDALLSTVTVTLESELGVYDMAINPTRPIVAISSAANSVTLYALRPDTLPWLGKVRDGTLPPNALPPGADLTPLIPVQAFHGHASTVTGVLLQPDDVTLLSCSTDQTVGVYDASISSRKGQYMHGAAALCLTVATVGSGPNAAPFVFVGGADYAIRAYAADPAAYARLKDTYARLATARPPPAYEYECARYMGHAGRIDSVAVHPQGGLLLSGARDFLVCVWSLTNPAPAVASGNPRAEEDIPRIMPLYKLAAHKGAVGSLAFSHPTVGSLLATAGSDHVVQVWKVGQGGDLSSAWRSGSVQGGAHASAVACVTWGKTLSGAAAGSDGGTVAGISDPRELLFSGGWDHTIKVWSGRNPARAAVQAGAAALLGVTEVVPLRTLTGHAARVSALSVSADGSTLVSVSADRNALVWDIRSGPTCIAVVQGALSDGALTCVSAGTTLFATGGDAGISLWPLRPTGVFAGLFHKPHSGQGQGAHGAQGGLMGQGLSNGALALTGGKAGADIVLGRTVTSYQPAAAGALQLRDPSSTSSGSGTAGSLSIAVAPRAPTMSGSAFDAHDGAASAVPLLTGHTA